MKNRKKAVLIKGAGQVLKFRGKNLDSSIELRRLAIASLLFGYAFWQSSWIAFASGFLLSSNRFGYALDYRFAGSAIGAATYE
ncbi:MAG: hypothetical protein Q8L98_07620 [Chlamydiales bacterium]|nr:hypothetical protein [Chlamydiales bacterium]